MDSDFNRAFLNLLIRSEIESISFDYLSCIIFNLKKRIFDPRKNTIRRNLILMRVRIDFMV